MTLIQSYREASTLVYYSQQKIDDFFDLEIKFDSKTKNCSAIYTCNEGNCLFHAISTSAFDNEMEADNLRMCSSFVMIFVTILIQLRQLHCIV